MISIFINSLTSGGAEKVVLTLIERFRNSGDPLELVLIEKEQFYDLPKDIPANYLTDYESLEKGPLKFPYLFVCAYRLKRSVRQPGQIIQSHLLRASFINIIAKILGSKHHAQIVVHSRINFDHKPFYYRIIAKWIYTQIFKRADSIISICEVMKRELDEYLGLKNHPLHKAIYNPHNLEEIKAKARMETPDFHFSKDKKYIISIGRIVQGKRIEEQINALSKIEKQCPDTELIILGDGDLRSKMEQHASNLGLNHKVHFLGFQKNPFAYLAKADLLILSSEWEGLPNILIEAMACGTAIVSADCISGPREIINPKSDLSIQLKNEVEYGEYGILYPVGATNLLAQAIQKILSDDILRDRYIQKGLERIQDFDQAKIASQYLRIFNKQNKSQHI